MRVHCTRFGRFVRRPQMPRSSRSMALGRFNQISRAAMLEGLMNVEGGGQAIPFVRSFHGSSSSYLWEDSSGITHTIPQGEGGEQGDPLMPLLFSLGQHGALQATDSDLNDNEFLFAFLVTTADRVGEVCKSLNKHLWDFSRIRINGGKTQVWNAIDDRPDFCDTLERIARAQDPDARVWWGSELPVVQQGSKSSAPLWDILLSWRHISARRPKNKHCFSSGSQLSLTYNLRGLSCFTVRRPERTIC